MTLRWHPHFEVWALVLVVGFLYSRVHASSRQRFAFVAGLLALFVASSWPVHELAEGSLYSVHMVQHMLFSLVAAPLLMVGTPESAWKRLLRPVLPLVRVLTRPIVALALFNGVLVFTHWPAAVNASVNSEILHFGLHVMVFGSALIMWTPVLSPIIELPVLSYPGRMFYLFLQSLVPTVPASFLTFGSTVLYRAYEFFPRPWGLSALADQQIAGLVMKIGGGFLLWGVIAVQFFRWYAREHSSGWDALSWRDVEHQARSRLASR